MLKTRDLANVEVKEHLVQKKLLASLWLQSSLDSMWCGTLNAVRGVHSRLPQGQEPRDHCNGHFLTSRRVAIQFGSRLAFAEFANGLQN